MNSKNDVIYLAGGCYWGLEKLLIDLSGVNETEVGFVGWSY
jgi:peptide methionine sulfoxide reductase MsrA